MPKASKTIAVHNTSELLKWLGAVKSLYEEDNGRVSENEEILEEKGVKL